MIGTHKLYHANHCMQVVYTVYRKSSKEDSCSLHGFAANVLPIIVLANGKCNGPNHAVAGNFYIPRMIGWFLPLAISCMQCVCVHNVHTAYCTINTPR